MSAGESLRLQRVRVRRSPGIDDGFTLDELSPGVNLVHGPNASGKTSTARAIEAVLWPSADATQRLAVEARYAMGSATYLVELDAGHLGVQRDGAEAPAPELPAPEFRQRYQLSLHDLLLATERSDQFAAEIARQSAGGYDFAAAARALQHRSKPSAATTELPALEEARRRLKEAQDGQAALHDDARELEALEARCAAAERARADERVLERAVHHARALAALQAARAQLDAIPAGVARLTGLEQETLAKLREQLRDAWSEHAQLARDAEQAGRDAADVLPHGPCSRELVAALRAHADRLATLETGAADAERRLRTAAAQVAVAREAIGGALTDAQLQALDGTTFEELSSFAHEADELDADAKALDAEVRHAEEGSTGAPAVDLDAMAGGARVLAQWLREPEPAGAAARRRLVLALCLAALAVAACGWLALAGHPAAAVGAVAAVVLAVLLWRDQRPPSGDARATRQRDYAALGLESPQSWSAEPVAQLLDRLQRQIADGRVRERHARWAAEARGRRRALAPRIAAVDARRRALEARLGVAPGDARRLPWIADHAMRWSDAMGALRAAEAELATARQQMERTLATVATRVSALRVPAPTTATDVAALAADLADRLQRHEHATIRGADARTRASAVDARCAELQRSIDALFEGAGCAHGDEAALWALCAERPRHLALGEAVQRAEYECAAARRELEEDARFDASLLPATVAELDARRRAASELSAEHTALLERCTTLRNRVDAAKRQSDVERALADVAAAEAALRESRARDLRAMIGDALARHVQQRTRDAHRPAVFRRARELFTRVTRGRYTLEFADGDAAGTPTFRAIDTRTQRSHGVNELSSATRVQLLLAVRVAFVEAQETGVRLPLFLDETLGTSDDHRAAAIIDAVIALAEDGRQVFYFTAQRDEVAKWAGALAERGLPHRAYDLAALRQLEPMPAGELPVTPLPVHMVAALPAVDGHSHESYGAALGVPVLSPGQGEPSATHLWYLVDELPALRRLLGFGVVTWGELQNLVESGGMQVLAAHPRAYARALALARAVAVMHEQSAIGRGRRVDRAVLRDSGAVSRAKLDEVARAALGCDGDARRLLDALERKEVSGFQTRKANELREFLELHGYLDARAPRTSAEIRTAMLGVVASEIASGVLDEQDVDRLLRRIEQRARPVALRASGGVAATAVVTVPGAAHPELPS